MQIDISPDLHAKLQQQVDEGRFPDVNTALRSAVDRLYDDPAAQQGDAIDALLLHAIAQSKSGTLFDGQSVSLHGPGGEGSADGREGDDPEQWN